MAYNVYYMYEYRLTTTLVELLKICIYKLEIVKNTVGGS